MRTAERARSGARKLVCRLFGVRKGSVFFALSAAPIDGATHHLQLGDPEYSVTSGGVSQWSVRLRGAPERCSEMPMPLLGPRARKGVWVSRSAARGPPKAGRPERRASDRRRPLITINKTPVHSQVRSSFPQNSRQSPTDRPTDHLTHTLALPARPARPHTQPLETPMHHAHHQHGHAHFQ